MDFKVQTYKSEADGDEEKGETMQHVGGGFAWHLMIL